MVVGGVEVYDGALTANGGEKLVHAIAEGGFSGSGRTDHELGEGHYGSSMELLKTKPSSNRSSGMKKVVV